MEARARSQLRADERKRHDDDRVSVAVEAVSS
jgi:hypothetical protein